MALSGTTALAASRAPAALTDPPVPGIPQRYLDQPVQWSVCSFDAATKALYPQAPTTNCATVKVPMDWNQPDAHPDIDLAIAYSQATGTSRGLLTSNPGGPGGAGISVSAVIATRKPQLFSDYDLLGFDPRGFGTSQRLRCLTTAEKLNALPTTPDYKERTEQTHRAEVAEAKLLSDACSATEFGKFVSSQQTVYDMEFLRALFDSRQLNFIGFSYGTWLGSWYADTFPGRVGRFLLDSNMDWSHTQWQNVNFDPFSSQRRRDTQMFPWMARHAGQINGLGSTPRQVTATYDRIRGQLVSMVKAGTSQMRGDSLDSTLYSRSYGNVNFIRATLDLLVHDEFVKAPSASGVVENVHIERAWARIAPALQAYDSLAAFRARYGVPAPSASPAVSASDAEATVRKTGSAIADARAVVAATNAADDEVVDLGPIGDTVRCNDTKWNHDPAFYLQEADRMQAKYPFYGYLNGVPLCAFWPYPPQDRDVDLAGVPRMLMVQSEFDPATAYEGSLRTHEYTRSHTRFLAIDDEGQHGQYVQGPSACMTTIADRYLLEGELPARDVVCTTGPLPEDDTVYPIEGPVNGKSVPIPEIRSGTVTYPPNPLLQQIFDDVAKAEASTR